MTRWIDLSDRRSLDPCMEYCRVIYKRNWDAGDTVTLKIQIFDRTHTQFERIIPTISQDAGQLLVATVMGQGWESVPAQHVRDGSVCYYQRPKSCDRKRGASPKRSPKPLQNRIHRLRSASTKYKQSPNPSRSPLNAWAVASVAVLAVGIGGHNLFGRWFPLVHHQMAVPDPTNVLSTPIKGVLEIAVPVVPIQQASALPNPFMQAVTVAEQAVLDGRVAETEAEWKDLSRRWWQAAQLMATVPSSDPQYAIAQDRVTLYQQNSEDALVEAAMHSVVLPINERFIASQQRNLNDGGGSSVGATPPVVEHAGGLCQDTFDAMIRETISSPRYENSQWGIHVESLSTGEVLYSHNSDDFFVPASNIKLYTTAAAFHVAQQHPSQELQTLIQNANLYSNNGSAEILLEKIGGSHAVKEILDVLGVDPGGYHQVDGSGLSRYNFVTPKSVVETLTVMHEIPGADQYYGTLPIGGRRGTLKNRFHQTPAYGIVVAKTGTLRGVRSLSGYLEHPALGPLAFSILVNQPYHSGYELLYPIDTIVVRLTELQNCAVK